MGKPIVQQLRTLLFLGCILIGTSASAEVANGTDSTYIGIRVKCAADADIFTIELDEPSEDFTEVTFIDHKGETVASAMFMEKRSHVMDLRGMLPGNYKIIVKSNLQTLVKDIVIPKRAGPRS